MEDLTGLKLEEKRSWVKPGRFFEVAPEVAIKPNGLPVLIKAESEPYKGFVPCKVLGPDHLGETTVQLNRTCELGNILRWLTDREAATMAVKMGAVIADQFAFFQ